MTAVRILRGGLLTTVQDLGRWGHQAAGVPVAGPMDAYSHRLANRLAGNHDNAAALEVTLIGPEIEAAGDVVCAVAGAEFELFAGSVRLPRGRAFTLGRGTILRFGRRLAGARASLAFRGGVAVDPVLGSRSSSLSSRMGPFGGRPLAADDLLPIGPEQDVQPTSAVAYTLPLPDGRARLRTLPAPDEDFFDADAIGTFYSSEFVVTPRSNRMGYRLQGIAVAPRTGIEALSEATPVGSVQVPRDGQPILLMADRQTTGGYPRIATVITADIPVAGQLAPGDRIRFARCSRAEAIAALRRQERMLEGHT